MSLYDGTGDDINVAGCKLSNVALKNTTTHNPKSLKQLLRNKQKKTKEKPLL